MTSFKLLIGGNAIVGSTGNWEDVVNPATDEVIGRVTHAGPEDLDAALAAAERGLEEWSNTVPRTRGAILRKAADLLRERKADIARTMTLEQGKPLAEAEGEIERSAEFLEWGGEQARRITDQSFKGAHIDNDVTIETHPIGVVAAFTPWNFPMALAAKKIAGALGAGCSIICKPSEETPGSTLALAQALLDAGVSPNAIAIVFGIPDEVSSHLITARQVEKVTFTGSIPVGKLLAARAGSVMKPVTMELGGHAPVIVCKDVDPEAVAEYLVPKKFANAGQICMSPSRFFIEAEIYDRFLSTFVAAARKIEVGSGLEDGIKMGPLANARRVEALEGLVKDACANNATLLCGGVVPDGVGNFFPPTVLTNVPKEARLMQDEPFGPIAAIMPFTDEKAMLQTANSLEFGLAGYVFGQDAIRNKRLADALEVGTVGINDIPTHLPEVPLGGWKESGYGVEGGQQILEPYQKTKFVSRCS